MTPDRELREITERTLDEIGRIVLSGVPNGSGFLFRADLVRQSIEAVLREAQQLRWIPVEERLPKIEELPCLVWRGTTHRIEVGRPMPPIGKGTQDRWMPLPAPPQEKA